MDQVLSPLLANTMKNPAMTTWRHSINAVGEMMTAPDARDQREQHTRG